MLGGRGRRPQPLLVAEDYILPHSEDCMILPSFVWTRYQRVTDRRTDRRNCCRYYSALHCKQCSRAVKTEFMCKYYGLSHASNSKNQNCELVVEPITTQFTVLICAVFKYMSMCVRKISQRSLKFWGADLVQIHAHFFLCM